MKKIPITTELLRHFREKPQTILFEGYCVNFDNVTVYNDGDSYALISVDCAGDTECCLFIDKISFINEVLGVLHGSVKFCGVSSFVTEYLQARYRFEWLTRCDLYAWNGIPLNTSVIESEIKPLDPSYAQQVSDGTPYRADVDGVRMCIQRHPSAAVYVDNRAVCWCLLHLEGSLGMLYTLPEFRRRGYALQVMTAISQMVIDAGNIPYAYIIEDNLASKSLAAKYNLVNTGKANYLEIRFED